MFYSVHRFFTKVRNSSVAQNAGWNVLGGAAITILNPIFSIIAARLLIPSDFGVFGIAVAAIAFLQIGKDLGLTQSVIVNEKADDFRDVQFTFQLIWSVTLFLLAVIISPLMASFYHTPQLRILLPLLGITLVLNSIIDPLLTSCLKDQNYRFLFFRQIVPTVSRGAVLVVMALAGAGVYALVVAAITGTAMDAVFLLWRSSWKPRLSFDWQQFSELFRLGRHLMFQEFCGFLVLKADSLIIGKNIGIETLGLYTMGGRLANILPNAAVPQITQVFFTDLAKNKGDNEHLIHRYYQFVYVIGLVSLGFSVALYFSAQSLVALVLGPKWLGSVMVIQAFSLVIPLIPLSVLNTQISKIYGFNHLYSYFSLVRALITAALVLIASFFSLKMVLLAWIVAGIVGPVTNNLLFFRNQKLVRVTTKYILLIAVCGLWAGVGLAGILHS